MEIRDLLRENQHRTSTNQLIQSPTVSFEEKFSTCETEAELSDLEKKLRENGAYYEKIVSYV